MRRVLDEIYDLVKDLDWYTPKYADSKWPAELEAIIKTHRLDHAQLIKVIKMLVGGIAYLNTKVKQEYRLGYSDGRGSK